MSKRRTILVLLSLGLAGCAGLVGSEPVRVQFAGLEPLPGEGFEWRMLLKLRVQNPNEQAVDFDGASVELNLRGQPFASGVSDARGSVPRFGEAVLSIPVTVSALGVAWQALDLVAGRQGAPLDFVLRGKLAGPGLGGVHFESAGQLTWPPAGPP